MGARNESETSSIGPSAFAAVMPTKGQAWPWQAELPSLVCPMYPDDLLRRLAAVSAQDDLTLGGSSGMAFRVPIAPGTCAPSPKCAGSRRQRPLRPFADAAQWRSSGPALPYCGGIDWATARVHKHRPIIRLAGLHTRAGRTVESRNFNRSV